MLVVLKFDRLSRSIRHFCELYETYFRSGEKELVAIRESIRRFVAGPGIGKYPVRIPPIVNEEGVPPPRSKKWNTSYLDLLAIRHNWHASKPHNERAHSDEAVKACMMELRNHGHTYAQIASILNEQKWLPVKGRKFTESSVGKLVRATEPTKYLTPKQYLEAMPRNMSRSTTACTQTIPSRGRGSRAWRYC